MITYPLPRFDQQKNEILQRYQILEGSKVYDTGHSARTAALVFGMPMVLAALNERYRAWFEASHGIEAHHVDGLQSFCALANLSEKAFAVNDVREEEFFTRDPAVRSEPGIAFFAGAPLRDPNGKRFGTLCLMDKSPRTITPEQLSILESFGSMLSNEICVRSAGRYAVADLIEVEEDKCGLYDMAMTDPLTSALNRRAFFHFAEREVNRAARHATQVSTIMFDIDHFKKVNDVHGHAAGDDVIKSLSGTALLGIRDEDLLGRLGGEEFALVLPETKPEDAVRLANRLREKVKSQVYSGENGAFGVTVSFGVSAVRPGDRDIHPALEAADKALYEAKRNGRDRVELDPCFADQPLKVA